MSGLHRQVDLSCGEQLRIWRRRMDLTRARAAETLRRSMWWVRATEGEFGAEPDRTLVPWCGSRDLAGHEKCLVYRLRAGVTQEKVAADLGCSRLWVNKMERGEVKCDDLLWYWEQ